LSRKTKETQLGVLGTPSRGLYTPLLSYKQTAIVRCYAVRHRRFTTSSSCSHLRHSHIRQNRVITMSVPRHNLVIPLQTAGSALHLRTHQPRACSMVRLVSLGLPRFGSELWFEPEPTRTGPSVQSKVHNNSWTGPIFRFRVRGISFFLEPGSAGAGPVRT
jgi:hypothetical protein